MSEWRYDLVNHTITYKSQVADANWLRKGDEDEDYMLCEVDAEVNRLQCLINKAEGDISKLRKWQWALKNKGEHHE